MSAHKMCTIHVKIPVSESSEVSAVKDALDKEMRYAEFIYEIVTGCEIKAHRLEFPDRPAIYEVKEMADGSCERVPTSSPGPLIEAQGIISRVLNHE